MFVQAAKVARCRLAATASSPADSGVVVDYFVHLEEAVSLPAVVRMVDQAFAPLAALDVFVLVA